MDEQTDTVAGRVPGHDPRHGGRHDEHQERRGDDARRRFAELTKGQRVALVATADAEGRIGVRPLTVQEREFDGTLSFFVSRSADWVRELDGGSWTTVTFADPGEQRWVAAVGRAELSDDRDRIRELWSPIVEAWFPGGADDPDLCVLCVEVEHADVWDSPRSRLVRLVEMARAVVGDTRADLGSREDLELGG